MPRNFGPVENMPRETQDQLLSRFADPFDAIAYCEASPLTAACRGTDSYLWKHIYGRITDLPLPAGKTYRQGCMFWQYCKRIQELPNITLIADATHWKFVRALCIERGEFPVSTEQLYRVVSLLTQFYADNELLTDCLDILMFYMNYKDLRSTFYQLRQRLALRLNRPFPTMDTYRSQWFLE